MEFHLFSFRQTELDDVRFVVSQFFPAIRCSAQPYSMHAGHFVPKLQKRSKTFMLSTLISLHKLLGTGDFVKVLLILLKGLSLIHI